MIAARYLFILSTRRNVQRDVTANCSFLSMFVDEKNDVRLCTDVNSESFNLSLDLYIVKAGLSPFSRSIVCARRRKSRTITLDDAGVNAYERVVNSYRAYNALRIWHVPISRGESPERRENASLRQRQFGDNVGPHFSRPALFTAGASSPRRRA